MVCHFDFVWTTVLPEKYTVGSIGVLASFKEDIDKQRYTQSMVNINQQTITLPKHFLVQVFACPSPKITTFHYILSRFMQQITQSLLVDLASHPNWKNGSSKSREAKKLLPSILTFPKLGARSLFDSIHFQVWGLKQAHFVGHSFGAFVVAWVLRYANHIVERTMEPDMYRWNMLGPWVSKLASIYCVFVCLMYACSFSWSLGFACFQDHTNRSRLLFGFEDPRSRSWDGAYQSSCFESFCWDSCMSICTLFHSGSWIVVLRLLFWLVGYFDTYCWQCIVFDSYNSMIIYALFDIITLCVYTMHSTYHDLCQCIYEL